MVVRSRIPKSPAALIIPRPVLHKRYVLEGEVGHGGCARVFRAWDAQKAGSVAIKRAHRDRQSCEMLLEEATILSALQHPRIPTFLEYFEEEGQAYLVEEWRSGGPLTEECFVSLAHTLALGRQFSEVLGYLHRHEVFHCDLAPDNVFLVENTITLLDFSFACRAGGGPCHKGTPGYASPEQWRAGVFGQATDIYSMAMVLGCALTASSPQKVRRAQSFTGLWKEPGEIPLEERPLLALLDQMIAFSPQARPSLSEIQRVFWHLEKHQLTR